MKLNIVEKVIYNIIRVRYSNFKAGFFMEPYKKGLYSTKIGSALVTKKNPNLVLFRTIFLQSV